MIKVTRVPAPADFDEKVKVPGMVFLRPFLDADAKPTSTEWKNHDYWKHARPALREAFNCRCAYLAMREIGDGEVDHFESKSDEPAKAYDWNNYRFANGEVNKKKSKSDQVLDPFLVEANWFRVDLVSGKVVATDHIPVEYRTRAEETITRLGLNKKSYRDTRLCYSIGCFERAPTNEHLELIADLAPLVAQAIRELWDGSTEVRR